MKYLMSLAFCAFLSGIIPTQIQAQNLLQRAKARTEKKLKKRANKTVDKAVDKGFEQTEKAASTSTASERNTAKTSSKSATAKAPKVDAQSILEAYFAALGGKEQLKNIRTMYISASSSLSANTGRAFVIEEEKVSLQGQKYRSVTSMNGKELETLFDGTRYVSEGQTETLDAASKAKQQLIATYPAELAMQQQGYAFKLAGSAQVQGKKTYKIVAENADKSERYQLFYAIDTGLKVQEIHTYMQTTQRGQKVKQMKVIVYHDYKAVDGIQVSHRQTQELKGMPINYEIKDVQFNLDLPSESFIIE